jgi:hypothetical protein
MLYGSPNITVYTDHRNNTFSKFSTQRVMRWRLILEDFGVQFKNIKGESNTLADALSRLPIAERQNTTEDLNLTLNFQYCQFDNSVSFTVNIVRAPRDRTFLPTKR